MNILVIGGTKFFGIHMVNELLAQRHDSTIATRGKAADEYGDKVRRDWEDGHEDVTVGCSIENQENADYRLRIFSRLQRRTTLNLTTRQIFASWEM